jgi:hypothetical protein
MEPISDILYPVVDNVEKIQPITDDAWTHETDNKVVAIISSSFYWRDVLKNVLPHNKRGLVVVFENPCSASFTYLIK